MWCNMAPTSDINKLLRTQDKSVKILDLCCTMEENYSKHKVLTLHELIKLENSKLWYKFYHNLLPNKLHHVMSSGPSCESLHKTHQYETRQKHELNSPKGHNPEYRKSFLYKGLIDYSNLPQIVKNARTLTSFVTQVKTHLYSSRNNSQTRN